MLILDTVNRSLEVVLGGAVATTQLPWTTSWLDITNATFAASGIAAGNGTTNGAVAVTVVAAPGVGVSRQLKELTVRNSDTAAAITRVQLNDTGTIRIIFSVTLAIGDILQYTDGEGFRVFNNTGAIKTVAAGGGGGAHAGTHQNGGVDEVAVAAAAANAIPKAGAGAQLDKAWYPDFIASGAAHAKGAVPDPGAGAGATKYLREDATWNVPPGGGGGTGTPLLEHSDSINTVPVMGDIVIANTIPATGIRWLALAGDVTDTRRFLTEQSIAGVAQPPIWEPIYHSDINDVISSAGVPVIGDLLVGAGAPPTWWSLSGDTSDALMVLTAQSIAGVAQPPIWVAFVAVTAVTGTLPITSTGGTTPDIAINNFGGDAGAGGTKGAVPAPPAGSGAAGHMLKASGLWGLPAGGGGIGGFEERRQWWVQPDQGVDVGHAIVGDTPTNHAIYSPDLSGLPSIARVVDSTGTYIALTADVPGGNSTQPTWASRLAFLTTQTKPILTFTMKTGPEIPGDPAHAVGLYTIGLNTSAEYSLGTSHAFFFFAPGIAPHSPNWLCKSGDGSSVESTDSGVPGVIDTRMILQIDCTDPASIVFRIDGVVVATHAVSVPVPTDLLFYFAQTRLNDAAHTQALLMSKIHCTTN